MKTFKSIAAGLYLGIAVVGLSAYSAQAVLMSADDPVFGMDSITQDSDTGLEWLDLNKSILRSFDDVSGQFGVGGDFEGWRYGTITEVTQLVANGGFPTPYSSSPATPEMLSLITMLGITVQGPNFDGTQFLTFARGIVDDLGSGAANASDIFELTHRVRIPPSIGPTFDTVFIQLDLALNSQLRNDAGSWLVRSTILVPEPGTLGILGLGLAGLGLARHRKAAA